MAGENPKLVDFRGFFDTVIDEGVSQVSAAELLLEQLQKSAGGIRAYGIRRLWDSITREEEVYWFNQEARWACLLDKLRETYGEDFEGIDDKDPIAQEARKLRQELDEKVDTKQRLPIETQRTKVDPSYWGYLESVKQDMTSIWIDEDEKPENWISVDWTEGSLEAYGWMIADGGQADYSDLIKVRCFNLKIAVKDAKKLLSKLTGKGETRGAPRGLKNPDEARWAREIADLIESGDKREIGAIVSARIPSLSEPQKDENRIRRVKDGVKKLLGKHNPDGVRRKNL